MFQVSNEIDEILLVLYIIYFHISKIFLKLKTNLKHINDKRLLVNLYKDIVLVTRVLYDIVYQEQHKSRDSNACLSIRSSSSFANKKF